MARCAPLHTTHLLWAAALEQRRTSCVGWAPKPCRSAPHKAQGEPGLYPSATAGVVPQPLTLEEARLFVGTQVERRFKCAGRRRVGGGSGSGSGRRWDGVQIHILLHLPACPDPCACGSAQPHCSTRRYRGWYTATVEEVRWRRMEAAWDNVVPCLLA